MRTEYIELYSTEIAIEEAEVSYWDYVAVKDLVGKLELHLLLLF